jgi:hypothetical protein
MELHPLIRILSIRPTPSSSTDPDFLAFLAQSSAPVFQNSDIQLMISAMNLKQSIDEVIEKFCPKLDFDDSALTLCCSQAVGDLARRDDLAVVVLRISISWYQSFVSTGDVSQFNARHIMVWLTLARSLSSPHPVSGGSGFCLYIVSAG